MMKLRIPSFKKIRGLIVVSLVLIFLFLGDFAKTALAIQGHQQADGTCLAYRLKDSDSALAATNKYYDCNFTILDGDIKRTFGDQHRNTNYPYYCESGATYILNWSIFKWNGSTWIQISYNPGYREGMPYSCSVIASMKEDDKFPNHKMLREYFESKQVPQNQYPWQYWPNGPPTNCGIPTVEIEKNQGPPCEPGQCCQ